jgi:hypothetical protein
MAPAFRLVSAAAALPLVVASLKGFAMTSYSESTPLEDHSTTAGGVFATSPADLRMIFGREAGASDTFGIAEMDANGTVLKATDPLSFTDDALVPGCNSAIDGENGRYYKTTTEVIYFKDSDGCDLWGGCGDSAVCCIDPTSSLDKGACV